MWSRCTINLDVLYVYVSLSLARLSLVSYSFLSL